MNITWIKAGLHTRTQTSTVAGTIWLGLDDGGNLLAATRFDAPIGYADFLTVLRAHYAREMEHAGRHAKPGEHVFAAPSITLKPNNDFGYVLSADQMAVLRGVAPEEMAWLTTDERRAISDSFGRMDAESTMRLAAAVSAAGVIVTIEPAKRYYFDQPEGALK